MRGARAIASVLAVAATSLLGGCSETARLDFRCTVGEIDSCSRLAEKYATGDGVPRDLVRAAAAYERVCDGGEADACNTAGEIYEQVDALASGPGRASELFTRACNGGSAFGCLNRGLLAAADSDASGAFQLFERACTGGAPAGCHRLAMALEQGQGTARNLPRAVELYDQACRDEVGDACQALATLFTAGGPVEKDFSRAAGYLAQLARIHDAGCQAGDERECEARDRTRTRAQFLAQQANPRHASSR